MLQLANHVPQVLIFLQLVQLLALTASKVLIQLANSKLVSSKLVQPNVHCAQLVGLQLLVNHNVLHVQLVDTLLFQVPQLVKLALQVLQIHTYNKPLANLAQQVQLQLLQHLPLAHSVV